MKRSLVVMIAAQTLSLEAAQRPGGRYAQADYSRRGWYDRCLDCGGRVVGSIAGITLWNMENECRKVRIHPWSNHKKQHFQKGSLSGRHQAEERRRDCKKRNSALGSQRQNRR